MLMNSNMYDGAMAMVPQLVKCPSQVSCAHSKTKRNLKTVLGFFFSLTNSLRNEEPCVQRVPRQDQLRGQAG